MGGPGRRSGYKRWVGRDPSRVGGTTGSIVAQHLPVTPRRPTTHRKVDYRREGGCRGPRREPPGVTGEIARRGVETHAPGRLGPPASSRVVDDALRRRPVGLPPGPVVGGRRRGQARVGEEESRRPGPAEAPQSTTPGPVGGPRLVSGVTRLLRPRSWGVIGGSPLPPEAPTGPVTRRWGRRGSGRVRGPATDVG